MEDRLRNNQQTEVLSADRHRVCPQAAVAVWTLADELSRNQRECIFYYLIGIEVAAERRSVREVTLDLDCLIPIRVSFSIGTFL